MKTHNFLFVYVRGGEADHEKDEYRDGGVDEQVDVAGGLGRLRGNTRALYRQWLPPTIQYSSSHLLPFPLNFGIILGFRIRFKTGLG